MSNQSDDMAKQALQYILDKLVNIFGINKKANNDSYEKFRVSFESKEISGEVEHLFRYGKMALIMGLSRDNSCIVVQKETMKKVQKKAVLILKSSKENSFNPDLYQNFIFVELSKNVLDQMFTICKEIFYPMMAHSVYQGENSELISKDLMEKFHNFLAHFYVFLGHVKKKTLLPVPSDDVFRNPKINDNEKTQICEGAVVMWIELIKNVLKQEPEFEFRNNADPDPQSEISFWERKSNNLESIIHQINGEQILEILKFLEKQKSNYYRFFNEIKKEVVQKSKEASQNYKFLSFLKNDFSQFVMDRLLPELVEYFIPIFHTIRLIWRDNEYYSKPERLIVLIRKICNTLIKQASNYINVGSINIFRKIIDADTISEAINKLETTREVFSKFMNAYFTYKDNDSNGWKITRNVIFYRLDAFNDRVGDILNIARSYNEFIKIQSKSLGGIKGEMLMSVLQEIFNECTKGLNDFTDSNYDCLDITSDVFNIKYTKYREILKELERRVAAVLTQTFDENDTIIGKFKILENFDTILERPNIVIELEKKYNILLDLFKTELRSVQMIFITGKEHIEKQDIKSPLNKNMPPLAAMLYWTNSLKERITEPFGRFISIGRRITEKEEFREIENLYHSIVKMVNDYENSKKQNWDTISKSSSLDKQKDKILVKRGELLQINFDPQLLQLLKEIKYFKILNLDIPPEAEAVYAKNTDFQNQIANLENIISQYNSIILSLNDVEKPIVQEKLKKLELSLEPAFTNITWEKSKNVIDEFVTKALNNISEMNVIVDKLKGFVSKIETILKEWKEKKLFIRPAEISEAKALNFFLETKFGETRSEMSVKSRDFTQMGEILSVLKTAVSGFANFKTSEKWINYTHYINSIIIRGITDMIQANLEYLYSNLDPSLNPFCSVSLVLESRKLTFEPELNDSSGKSISIKGMALQWINTFINLSTISRVRVDGPGDYMIEVLENFSIQEMVYRLYLEINLLVGEGEQMIDSFKEYKILWEKDFNASFTEFLKDNTVFKEETPEQKENSENIMAIFGKKNPITIDVVENTPPKEIFDDKINELKTMLKKVNQMEKEVKVRWILVNLIQFKNELTKIIEKWIDEYKNFLQRNAKNKITNIRNFISKVYSGIYNVPEKTDAPADKSKFIRLLEIIRDMNLLYPKIIEILPTVKGELEILKKHTRITSEDDFLADEEKEEESEEHKLLVETEEIEKNIKTLNKNVEEVRQNINELIEKESTSFKMVAKSFDHKVENFRNEFLIKIPKTIESFTLEEINWAYDKLDQFQKQLKEFEKEKKANNNMEHLLGLTQSNNKQISDCLSDLNLYKTLWDYASILCYIFENWKKMKMDKIENGIEFSEKVDILKNMLKVPTRKELKLIPGFINLTKHVSNMADVIAVISNLKSKAIKPRHWKHIMELTGKVLPYGNPDFSVEDLIKLEMYKYTEICDMEKTNAVDQEKVETDFTKIEKHWQNQDFKMTKKLNNKEYKFFIFDYGPMDAIIEVLEKHQVELIKMLQKKSTLDNFEGMDKRITDTLAKLKIVNDVIKLWLKFQKNWEKLRTIMRAEDIKNKLNEEFNKFKNLNSKFKAEMKIAADYNRMANVCNEEKKFLLLDMSEKIAEVQRRLEEYLDEKKKLFPRFYFLSNDTLLNMLSYGDYPSIINKNVKDCFDGIKSWAMTKDDEKGSSNTVLGMISSENDEEVWFDEPFVCQGRVELYLGEFEEKMRKTLKDILFQARCAVQWETFEKKDKKKILERHKWLEPYPAQLALLVTQNVWTEEVEHAFEELVGGLENPMKDFYTVSKNRIDALIDRVREKDVEKDLRVKIITIITVDVHARDVVEFFITNKIQDNDNFNWKKQLRFKYSKELKDVSIMICDYETIYSYEYIGNTGRLVITPLTDRCYITLTQALNLVLGGAPAGPAGTGKTETTKDLGRNLGLAVIVNNCSEQMDIDTTARIFSGLAQTGFWGCFDEFNRISIEVLSVVSTQVKTILDAMRNKQTIFTFFDSAEIKLVTTCGFFITMNPGYAGRTELPDNLKALFRWCAMVVPELEKICENMLMSEGFKEAKQIAKKFITLYSLSRDLLSKQKHYDWGLRAIKSLLRQAGSLKRHPLNQATDEMSIMMKALYDFNKAKIVPDDLPIFEGLLQDLFKEKAKKGLSDVDVNKELNEKIEEATESEEINLQKDASFTKKIRQLEEIMQVRHCVFVLGEPGTGKTSIWKTLFHTMKDKYKMEAAYDKLSPKAITNQELFGAIDKTKTWRFGVLSSIMRKMCKSDYPYKESMKMKWIILDGDIDPGWIESLNTVMDDNKVLTLNSGDRFPLDEYMRLIFEISNLRNATLATVSRGGVLYVNSTDIGIAPYLEKWIKTRYPVDKDKDPKKSTANHSVHNECIKSVLQILFKNTFEKVKLDLSKKFVAPMVEINLLQNVCAIIQNLIEDALPHMNDMDEEKKKLVIEGIYFYAFMWGVGGSFIDKKDMVVIVNHNINKKIRFPDNQGTCFEYFFDYKNCQWVHWSTRLNEFRIGDNLLFQDIIVPNVEVLRMCKIIELNILEQKPVLIIGDAGTGKTAIIKYFLKSAETLTNKLGNTYQHTSINFNSFTESLAFQEILESKLTIRFANKYGPNGNFKLIYFLDDLNMPALDIYGTQSHIELLRQVIDYKEMYDRKNLEEKKILDDILFVACQNPKAGSFKIDLRLQRHFTALAASEPKQEIITDIYVKILKNHLTNFKFRSNESVEKVAEYIITASCQLLERIRKGEKCFTPSASKFHYQWNLREISRVIEGVLRTNNSFHKDVDQVYKLWLHECNRVFRDRLIYAEDQKRYDEVAFSIFDINFKYPTANKKDDVAEPFIFVPFDDILDESDNVLVQPKSYDALRNYIEVKLEDYNNSKVRMPLVLFDDAIMHISRIARIISNPASHALLVGVGGSGKQSLCRLAAFIKGTNVLSPNLTGSDYNSDCLLEDIKLCLKSSCMKSNPEPCIFMMNDNHIIEEYFLVYINNFLASSWIDQLYENKVDLDNELVKLKSQAISNGFMLPSEDDLEKLFNYLLYTIKNNVHIVLCMSPVGEKLRVRARKFPGILNCTNINWFHEWPDNALEKVAISKVSEMSQFEDGNEIGKLAKISSEIHKSIQFFNDLYFAQERRYNYTTPKSFLELIEFFKLIVTKKDSETSNKINRLEKGLSILEATSQSITKLKAEIEIKSAEVEIEKGKTEKILEELQVEQVKIEKETEIVTTATAEAIGKSEMAAVDEKEAHEALNKAEPIKRAAKANAESIDVGALNNFKNSISPSEKYMEIYKLIYMIFYPASKTLPNDYKTIKSKCLMIDANGIKNKLKEKLENIEWLDEDFLVKVKRYREHPYTDAKEMALICGPAVNITAFFHNCVEYKIQYDNVKPIQKRSETAKAIAEEAKEKKEMLEKALAIVLAQKKEVEDRYLASKAAKDKVEAEEKQLLDKLQMAEKFISLLSGNKIRWTEEVSKLKNFKMRLAGDCMLASSFISYIGVFNSLLREKLINKWKTIISAKDILLTNNIELVKILITDTEILKFKSEGLPADPFSTENAAIMTMCTRWPLIIDPQMQAIKWIKKTGGKKSIVQYKQKEWENMIGNSISSGEILIIEDVDQEIHPLLVPILARETYFKPGSKKEYLKVGSEECELHPNTKIYLFTKISNPHYKPEIIAQCTLVNFIVTERGLEDQLLAMVVDIEQPELEQKIKTLIDEINDFQRELLQKEDDVLLRLEEADPETILENVILVSSLEATKARAQIIEDRSKITEELITNINHSREAYRKIGEEGAMLFFIISKLFVIQFMYQYSLESFIYFFTKSILNTEKTTNLTVRVNKLRENIRVAIYLWVTSGMFEKDKQLLLTMIALRLLEKKEVIDPDCAGIKRAHIDFLLKAPMKLGECPKENTLNWMEDSMWRSLCALSDLDGFQDFSTKMEREQYTKFKEWFSEYNPEDIPLPLEWRKYKKHSFHKILVLRVCRPDRISIAINEFVRNCIARGPDFLEARTFSDTLAQSYNDSLPTVPIFFILSPGSNPIKELEVLGRKVNPKKPFVLGKNFFSVAMGQRADKEAELLLHSCYAEGHWLFLQNIHLMPKWLKNLQDLLKELSKEKGNDDFRLFLSAEPTKNIPVGILEKCIKLSNEPPSGLKKNMKIALCTLKDENPQLDDKNDRKRINVMFGLCYYHAVLIERKKFGTLGWNRNYPFNLDDLRNSDAVVAKYMETNQGSKLPWDDLRYIVGEIMYGGHIVNDEDRSLNMAYLEYILHEKINDDLELVPYPSQVTGKLSLKTPANNPNFPYEKWPDYIDQVVSSSESPFYLGLHSNAELDFRIRQSLNLFQNLFDLEPKDSSGGEETEGNKNERLLKICDDIFLRVQDKLKLTTSEERTPAYNVFIQECEQMNILLDLIFKNATDIKDALEGRLTRNEEIEKLISDFNAERVPSKWIEVGFETNRRLGEWLISLELRIAQYKLFETENVIPKIVFINRLFNPLSYLTAIRQNAARQNSLELDQLDILTEPTSIDLRNGVDNLQNLLPKEGSGVVPIYGMHLQGARWDEENRRIEDSRPREDFSVMPVINCRVVDKKELDSIAGKGYYACPVYKTTHRDTTLVTKAFLKTSQPPAKWLIAGVAVILDVEKTDNITKYPK